MYHIIYSVIIYRVLIAGSASCPCKIANGDRLTTGFVNQFVSLFMFSFGYIITLIFLNYLAFFFFPVSLIFLLFPSMSCCFTWLATPMPTPATRERRGKKAFCLSCTLESIHVFFYFNKVIIY